MRDRLTHLQEVQVDPEGFSTVELGNLPQHEPAAAAAAAGAEASQPEQDVDLEGVLQEAQHIRQEIKHIQDDISDLRDVNYQALNQTSHPVATKKDSRSIGADVKRRGEDVLRRLQAMSALCGELESQRGASDPTARIARTQYQCLSSALREVMFSYNDTEMGHRDACKQQICRQMEVVGREVTKEELEEMMESGELNVFSGQAEGKTAHSAALQIESRHKELLELEERIRGVQELFLDVAMLVEEQGAAVDNIQKNVQKTEGAIQDGVYQLDRAKASDNSNPCRNMFCCCFPSWIKN